MTLARKLAVGVALAITSATGAARAQAPRQDAVTVTDGTVWRGRITELASGDHVTLQLPDGQMARIRWEAIAKIDGATETVGPTVRVRIDAEVPVILERVAPRGTPGIRYTPVCASPCDRNLPANDTYRIRGGGIRSSSAFTLRDTRGEPIVLSVDQASTGNFVGGIILTSLGGVSVAVGTVVFIVGAALSDDPRTASRESRGLEMGGAITTVIGLAMLVPGIVMLANSSTTVHQHFRTQPPAASTRGPTWAKTTSTPEVPAAFALPIVDGVF